MDRQAFHDALEEIWRVVRDANRCVDEDAPWTLRKTEPAKMATVLYVLAETIRHLAIVLQPFMPDSCGKMLDQLSVAEDARTRGIPSGYHGTAAHRTASIRWANE